MDKKYFSIELYIYFFYFKFFLNMSVFASKWIVFSKKQKQEKLILYTIFFYEYGILEVKQKKWREKNLDIWYEIHCEISTSTQQQKHILPSIGNIFIRQYYNPENKNYLLLHSFLAFLKKIHSLLPYGHPHYEIYTLLSKLIKKNTHCTQTSFLLAKLKIQQLMGEMPTTHANADVQKVLQFIYHAQIDELLKLKQLPQEIEKELACIQN